MLGNHTLQVVDKYLYLSHIIKQKSEHTRRIRLTRAAFEKFRYIFKEQKFPINLKRKVFNTCVLPVATYGQETATLTKGSGNRMRTCQKAIEWEILGTSLNDNVRNEEIRKKTNATDAAKCAK